MNLNELKAFIEGIEHAFGGEAPTAAQWQLIKDKIHQLEENTEPKYTLRQDRVRINPLDLIPKPPEPLGQITRSNVWQEPHVMYRGFDSVRMLREPSVMFTGESG